MAFRDKFKEIDESQEPPLRKWYLKKRLRDREAENGRAPPPAQPNPNLDRGYMKLPLEIKVMAHRSSPTLTTAMNWLLADSWLYKVWSPFTKDNMVDDVAKRSLAVGRSRDLLNRLFTPHTQHIMLCLLRYPDPYMPKFAELLDKIDRGVAEWGHGSPDWVYDLYRLYMRACRDLTVRKGTDSVHVALHSLDNINQLAPTYDAILEFMDDYVKKCLSTHPEEAHELPPAFAEASLQVRKGPTPTETNNAKFYRDWDAPTTVASLPGAERERIISAAWLFEYTAMTVRQIGWFDYGGDPTDPDQYYQRGLNAARTKNQVSMSHSACQTERLACIYNYVRGLYKQIFHSLEEEFIDEFKKRVASHEAGTLGVPPPDDEYEVRYTWRTLQALKDPECFPKIFISRVAQREYIDVLCSFGLRFLYHVLRMSQADRRKMIVRTFHPIRGLQSEPMSVEEPIFRRVLGTERDHWELKPEIVVEEGRWSDDPSDAAGYVQNMAWVNYHVRRSPQDPNNWESSEIAKTGMGILESGQTSGARYGDTKRAARPTQGLET
ncbi:hypothetical protein DL770_006891 [Monosporascus sp. CRB-9-2]|nr:hypothetical protein DL770_006891 [Monosporascus sp. CRB-9-2]